MEVHERIRYLRKDVLKLTQQEFSDSLKISRSNMGNIETGRIAVTDRVLLDICDTYNIHIEWLKNGVGDIFVPKTKNQAITDFLGDVIKDDDSFKKRLVESLVKFEPEDWKDLERLLTKFIK